MSRARRAVAVLLILVSLPVGAFGLLYVRAIWTSDTADSSLLMIGVPLLALAAILVASAARVARGEGHGRLVKPS